MAEDEDERLALVAPEWRVVKSFEKAHPGEVVLVDEQGRAATRGTYLRYGLRMAGFGAVGGIGMVVLYAINPLFAYAVGAVAASTAFLAELRRRGSLMVLKTAVPLIGVGRYREAAEQLVPQTANPRCPPIVLRMAAATLSARGDNQTALALLERCAAEARGVERHLNHIGRISLLIYLERIDEARRLEASLEPLPPGDLSDLVTPIVPLIFAFHTDDLSGLPGGDVRHAWARTALLRNTQGGVLFYLAWVAWREDEIDLANHLFTEAVPRSRTVEPDLGAPRFRGWVEARSAEWGIPLVADAI
jgi:hypothetical protein